jgi:hypothetical protein
MKKIDAIKQPYEPEDVEEVLRNIGAVSSLGGRRATFMRTKDSNN